MIVFKLERERPAYCLNGNTLCWVKDRQLKSYDLETGQEELLVQLRRNTYPPLSLSYCPSEQMALFYYDNDGGTFELYSIPKSGSNADDVKKGFYTAAVFFSRSKFAVLDKTRQVFHSQFEPHLSFYLLDVTLLMYVSCIMSYGIQDSDAHALLSKTLPVIKRLTEHVPLVLSCASRIHAQLL